MREDVRGNSREFPHDIKAAYTKRGMKTGGIVSNKTSKPLQGAGTHVNTYIHIHLILTTL